MTDTPYNMPSLGLFGKRCRILTGYDKRPFVYRIVNSEWMSNTWCEPPITYQSEMNPVKHDHIENVLIVVIDTLIDENSRLIRVALKDVELMDEFPGNAGWISVKDRLPPMYHMVLITGKNSAGGYFGVIKGSYDGDESQWYRDDIGQYVDSRGDTVTHWMPLPEPPKEE